MNKSIYFLIAALFSTSIFADTPPLCPSAADMKNAKFISMPVANVSVFSAVDNGMVVVNGMDSLAAKVLLSATTAPYTLSAQPIPIDSSHNIYYCAYAPGANMAPSQEGMGIYWISVPTPQLISILKK